MLTELLRDKDPGVKENAAACIGELMFYIAAQESSVVKAQEWNIPPTTITALIKCLKPGEDEKLKQNVVQTIENVNI